MKYTSTWEYRKPAPSNKWGRKKKIKSVSQKVGVGKTLTNGPENKETYDDALGQRFQRWHWQYVSRKGGGRGLASIEDR